MEETAGADWVFAGILGFRDEYLLSGPPKRNNVDNSNQ